jgi:hypothetical protein
VFLSVVIVTRKCYYILFFTIFFLRRIIVWRNEENTIVFCGRKLSDVAKVNVNVKQGCLRWTMCVMLENI